MSILSTIPNGASNKDIRDTINALLADVAALKVGGGTGTPTPTPTPTVRISAAQSIAEGNSGTTTFTYTVTLSAAAGAGGVAVPWTFAAGGTSADDFAGGAYPAGGSVNIPQGSISGTFTVSVAGDTTVEGDETFTVSIATPAGYGAGTAMSATGTILNDDAAAAPAATFGSTSSTWGNSANTFGKAA